MQERKRRSIRSGSRITTPLRSLLRTLQTLKGYLGSLGKDAVTTAIYISRSFIHIISYICMHMYRRKLLEPAPRN